MLTVALFTRTFFSSSTSQIPLFPKCLKHELEREKLKSIKMNEALKTQSRSATDFVVTTRMSQELLCEGSARQMQRLTRVRSLVGRRTVGEARDDHGHMPDSSLTR